MFIVLVRAVLVLAALTAIYLALVFYQRWDVACRLAAEHAEGADPSLSREDYINRGLLRHERSFSRRALYAVFLLPLAIGTILGVLAVLT